MTHKRSRLDVGQSSANLHINAKRSRDGFSRGHDAKSYPGEPLRGSPSAFSNSNTTDTHPYEPGYPGSGSPSEGDDRRHFNVSHGKSYYGITDRQESQRDWAGDKAYRADFQSDGEYRRHFNSSDAPSYYRREDQWDYDYAKGSHTRDDRADFYDWFRPDRGRRQSHNGYRQAQFRGYHKWHRGPDRPVPYWSWNEGERRARHPYDEPQCNGPNTVCTDPAEEGYWSYGPAMNDPPWEHGSRFSNQSY